MGDGATTVEVLRAELSSREEEAAVVYSPTEIPCELAGAVVGPLTQVAALLSLHIEVGRVWLQGRGRK